MIEQLGSLLGALVAGAPVAWRRWGAATHEEARERDLPLLVLLVGSCDHWSARQLHEIHTDSELCALIETAFVPVLAAVHLQPVLARRVQECLGITAEATGWPAFCCCTPAGEPFLGLPFRPARDADGQLGLARCLLELSRVWIDGAQHLREQAASLTPAWSAATGQAPLTMRAELLLDLVEAAVMAQADSVHGGFGQAPKRPQPALLAFLLERSVRAGAPPGLVEQAVRSCQALVAGAVHDQLAGGFHRACLDALWCEPLFEKRLVEQALLAPCLLRAAGLSGAGLLRDLAEQALDWSLEQLGQPAGGFAHGLHAVSRDRSGRPDNGAQYRWTLPGVANVVGEKGAAIVWRRFCDPALPPSQPQVFSVRQELTALDADRLPSLCARLFAARGERPPPPREDWSSVAEQGMMLLALAEAARGQERYQRPGERLFTLFEKTLASGGLAHCWHPQQGPHGRADCADLAWAARGALAWHDHSGDPVALGRAEQWLDQLLRPWLRAAAAVDEQGVLAEPVACVADDDEGPGALAVALHACLDLHRLRGGPWRDRAANLLRAHSAAIRSAPLACAGLATVLARDPGLLG